jgi:hypothetical protein
MNIILFGESPSAHFLSQNLLELENVSRVFHYGASPKVYSSTRYHPLFTLEKDIEKFILELPLKYHFDLIVPMGLKYQLWSDFRKIMLDTGIPILLPDERLINLIGCQSSIKKILTDADLPYRSDIEVNNKFSFYAICNNKSWAHLGTVKNYKDIKFCSPFKDYDDVVSKYVQQIFTLLKLNNYNTRFILKVELALDSNNNVVILKLDTSLDNEFLTICSLVKNNLADILYNAGADIEFPKIEFKNNGSVSLKIVTKTRIKSQAEEFPQLWPVTGNVTVSLNNPPLSLHSIVSSCDENIDLARNNIYNFLKNKPMGNYTYIEQII